MTTNLEYPILTGDPVIERHARICRENGHADYTINGVSQGYCPRCGALHVTDGGE